MVFVSGPKLNRTSCMRHFPQNFLVSRCVRVRSACFTAQNEVRTAQEETASLRGEVKTLDHQLQLSRGSVTSLESQLTTSQVRRGFESRQRRECLDSWRLRWRWGAVLKVAVPLLVFVH